MRQLVPTALVLGLVLGCGARVSEQPLGPDEHEGRAGNAGDGDGDGDADHSDAGPPWIPPEIEVCFAAGTPIATPGGEHAIETIEVGDLVWAFDVEREQRVIARVSAVHRHEEASVGRLSTSDGRVLRATPNHPIYVRERAGFVAAAEIDGGETLLALDDASELGVASVEASPFLPDGAREPVWNLTVERVHTYFAAGLLVHNKQPEPECHYPYVSNGYTCVLESCFAPGTEIATPYGERAIESLRVGDAVWGYDVARGARIESRVSAVHVHEAREVGAIVLSDGRTLYATDNHPFYDAASGIYVPASELNADSRLLSIEGATHTLAREPFARAATHSVVHNITVEGVHNYFAGGVLVHNKEAPLCPTYDFSTDTGCEHPIVGRGPDCGGPYPTLALSAEQYVARVNEALFSVHDPARPAVALAPGSIPDLSRSESLVQRNTLLGQHFGSHAAFELGSALARWLRVPAPAAPSKTGSLDDQLYWQIAMNLGDLVARPEGLSVTELLSYPGTVMTPELAELYGLFDSGQGVGVLLPPERRGLLTEIAFLRAHPTPSDRGRVIDELFDCGAWQEHVPPMPPPLALTTRFDAYANIDATSGCGECHAELDRIGLPLERFDELGAHRLEENGLPITPVGIAAAMDVEGAHQLSSALATLPTECVARSVLSSVLERPLVPEDFCSIDWVVAGMQGRADVRGALLSAITSPAFLHADPGAL